MNAQETNANKHTDRNRSNIYVYNKMIYIQGVTKNAHSECCWSHSALAQSQVAVLPVSGNLFFGLFLLRLSLVKPSKVMFMVKFGRTVLNFWL